MKNFKLLLLVIPLIFGLGYIIGSSQSEYAIYNLYRKLTTPNAAPKTLPSPLTPTQKAEIDAQIQQQYQKLLSQQQAPEQKPSSKEEKQEMLDHALSELDHAEDEHDREVAVMTLGEMSGNQAKLGLLNALQDTSGLVVTQTIRQISKWPNPSERIDMLLAALQHPNDEIVLETLLTINLVDDKKLITRLKQFTKHSNPEIGDAARLALNLAE